MTTILLVEDNRNQRLLYEKELRFEGYEIVTATDGKDVLNKVREQPLDLVVMDFNLLKMDGIETMSWILSKHKNIPIIINTAYSNYKDNFITWAADAFIIKSSDLTELKNKIKKVITNKDQKLQGKIPTHNDTEKDKHERLWQEKRKYRRIEKPYITRFRIKPDKIQNMVPTKWDLIGLKNLCAGGIFFAYPENLGIDSNLDLKIDISTSTPTINCVGKIIRVEDPQPHSMCRIATEFTEIDKQEKELINTTVEKVLV